MINFSSDIYEGFVEEYLKSILAKVEKKYLDTMKGNPDNPFFKFVKQENLREILVGSIIDNHNLKFINEYRKTMIFSNFKLLDKNNDKIFDELEKICKTNCLDDAIIKHPSYRENNSELEEIQKEIKAPYEEMQEVIKQIFKYGDINYKLRAKIMEFTGIFVCPYCDRNFISSYKIDNRNKQGSSAQLDHFFPKSAFPLFSLSLYNFVPACSHCNASLKGDTLLLAQYPYNDKRNEANIFKIKYENYQQLIGNEQPMLSIVTTTCLEQYDAKVLNLDNMYKNHLSLIKEVSEKNLLYTQSYKDSVNQLFDEKDGIRIQVSDNDLAMFLFGYGKKESELTRKPLAKLMQELIPDEIGD